MLNVITLSVVFHIVILRAGILSVFALGIITLSVMILIDILCRHAELVCIEFHLC